VFDPATAATDLIGTARNPLPNLTASGSGLHLDLARFHLKALTYLRFGESAPGMLWPYSEVTDKPEFRVREYTIGDVDPSLQLAGTTIPTQEPTTVPFSASTSARDSYNVFNGAQMKADFAFQVVLQRVEEVEPTPTGEPSSTPDPTESVYPTSGSTPTPAESDPPTKTQGITPSASATAGGAERDLAESGSDTTPTLLWLAPIAVGTVLVVAAHQRRTL
jgi:hypothetical protein